ncbi:T9SS type A sorting domain-containing protein [bacterium]|nr:T9SS type A sorting domain-containing protein [bacterium]RQV95503.1 MAG: T9SS C-terminal target domain-containing protein [bacterium]
MKIMRMFILSFICLLLSFVIVTAQDTLNVKLQGRWAYGPSYAVKIANIGGSDYAFIGNGGYLQVIDLGAGPPPDEEGKIALPEPLKAVDVASISGTEYAFVADGAHGLRIIDVSTPATPVEVGTYDTPGIATDVVVDPTLELAFIADGLEGLIVIDVSTPASPTFAGNYAVGGEACGIAYWYDGVSEYYVILTHKDYDVANNNVVRTYNVTDPANIIQQDIFYTVDRPMDVYFDAVNEYAFIADSSGLRILDVTDPTNMTQAGYISTKGTARSIFVDVASTYAYIADEGYDYGFQIFNVSTPATPVRQDSMNTLGTAWAVDVDVANGYAYISDGLNGLKEIDIAPLPPAAPITIVDYGLIRDVAVLGIYAYVADGDDGIREIDISVSPPVENANNTTDFATCTALGLDVYDDTLYVASGSAGIQIFAISDITTLVGSYNTSGTALNVIVAGDYAYVADANQGLKVLDVSDGTGPTLLGSYTHSSSATDIFVLDDWVNDVALFGNYVYLTIGFKGIIILDISTPASPTFVGEVSIAGEVYSVALNAMGTYAYVADGIDGLQVVNVSTTSSPFVAATLNTNGQARDVAVTGNYAYVADGTYGLRVINIFVPTNPQEVAYYNTGDDAYGVIAQDADIYVADNKDGLYILDNLLAHASYFVTPTYDVVDPTGRSIPVVIQNASILGKDVSGLQAGDEIAIFDGDTVVGVGVYEGIFPLPITVWMRYEYVGGTLKGAWEGNKMIFKIWNKSTDSVLGAFATYTVGNGTFTETQLLTVVNPLIAYELTYFQPSDTTGVYQLVVIENNITINGVSIVTGDEIGIFDGNLCVGAAEYQGTGLTIPVWLETNLSNGVHLTGAVRNNPMRFKIYQDVTADTFKAMPIYHAGSTGLFSTLTVTVDTLKAYTYDTQNISVKQSRLNLISFNVSPLDSADREISVMLDDIESLLIVWDDEGNSYAPGIPTSTSFQVNFTKGYYIYYSAAIDETAINQGFILLPQDYTRIFTNTKTYMIAYPYWNSHYATEVFAQIQPSLVVLQDDNGLIWVPGYGINTIDQFGGMKPGKGYKLYVNQTVSYTYPVISGGGLPKAKSIAQVEEKKEPEHFSYQETGLAYPVIILGSETPLETGDEIGLFAGDLCVGATIFTGAYPFAVSAWEAVNLQNIKIPGFKKGEPISVCIWSPREEKEYIVSFECQNQTEPTFGVDPIYVVGLGNFERSDLLPTTYDLGKNYPNPFNPETNIAYQLPEANRVELLIFNTLGQRIRTLIDERKEAGYYTVKWDGLDERGLQVGSGIYFIRMQAGNIVKIEKMTLIK